jgi:hypothetical protein
VKNGSSTDSRTAAAGPLLTVSHQPLPQQRGHTGVYYTVYTVNPLYTVYGILYCYTVRYTITVCVYAVYYTVCVCITVQQRGHVFEKVNFFFIFDTNSGAISIIMYLYVIADDYNDIVKLGYSEDPHRRCAELQTGNPNTLRVVHRAWAGDRCALMENILHREFAYHRVRGEWYRIPPDRAANYVDYVIIRYLDDPLVE